MGSANVILVAFAFLLYFKVLLPVDARVRHHKWDVKYEFRSPDCYKKLVITVNGQNPGPTIFAQQGDTVIVDLTNSLLTEGVAVHWHGIRQLDTNWADGAEGVTQCPIVPGDTFRYKFVVDRPGTYMYHAHYGMQRLAGLYGMIQVALPDNVTEPYAYDFDRRIILNDWYHNSTYEQAVGLNSLPFVWVGEPQSILIHGKGNFSCSRPGIAANLCNATSPDCSPFSLTVIPGKTYRLRIGSLTSLSALSFAVEGHNMTVVEADGHNVEPFVVQNLFIYSGETYSVLVKADQNPSRNYWISASIVSRPSDTPPGLGVFRYYPTHPSKTPPNPSPVGPVWNDSAPRMAQSLATKALNGYIIPPPAKSDRVIQLLNTQNRIDGRTRWSVNNVSFSLPSTPYLVALKHKMLHTFDQTPAPDSYDDEDYATIRDAVNTTNFNATSSTSIYRLEFNSTVDVILQNVRTMKPGDSETHPWHLHGHDFWVLGYGTGRFNISSDPQKFNLVNPVMKNTVAVHPFGWTALRFRADNPGVWLFHCHIESHFFLGMGVVFESGIDKVGTLPSSIMGCGATKRFYKP